VEIDDPGALPPPGRTAAGMFLHGPGMIGVFDFSPAHEGPHGPLTREELRASVRRVTGVDVAITSVTDTMRFTDNARQVTTYRIGRVLLAGDAAHVHSPNGGQGLNLVLRRDRLEVVTAASVGHDRLSAVLIRPDGAIAWANAPGEPCDAALLRTALRTWLGAPARTPSGSSPGAAAAWGA